MMSPVATPAARQPSEAMASVLGEPIIQGSPWYPVMASHVTQRHAVFQARLSNLIALPCPCALVRRQGCQWYGIVKRLGPRKPMEKRLARTKVCRENKIFGEEMQVLCRSCKRLADANAALPTFVFGKVPTQAAPSST